MLALYLLSLAASAGVVGLFAYQLLAGQGFVPAFSSGVYLTIGTAFLYVTLQLLYMVVVRFYKPTKDATPLFIEIMSHASVAGLVPYLLHQRLPLPTTVSRFEPLVYLALFLTPHVFFKLMSFFAAVKGTPGTLKGGFAWLGAMAVTACVAYVGLTSWMVSMEALRPELDDTTVVHRVGGQFAQAREVPEGSQVRLDIDFTAGQALEFLWAPDPSSPRDQTPGRIHVSITLEGSRSTRLTQTLALERNGWSGMRLGPAEIPHAISRCRIVWNAGKEPLWQRLSGVAPVVTSSRRLLLAGPHVRQAREATSPPNLVVVVVDGLNANRIGKEGTAAAKAAPGLSRLAASSVQFVNAYSPIPESAPAVVSLMTGATPLRHGYLGTHRGTGGDRIRFLAERLGEKGYATAAFTEGRQGGYEHGAGLERGFFLYDDYDVDEIEEGIQVSSAVVVAGSTSPSTAAPTDGIARASAWLERHRQDVTMAFLRLRGLEAAVLRETDLSQGSITVASYESALRVLDRKLSPLLRTLQDQGNTCILVTGSFGAQGLDDDGLTPANRLAEVALHVPCILYVPGQKALERKEVVSLEDLTAVLLRLASGESEFLYGESPAAGTEEAVSMSGTPLALSIRSGGWRLTWQTSYVPFTALSPAVSATGPMALYDVELVRRGRRPVDAGPRNRDAVARLHRQLVAYLQLHADSQ